MDRVLLLSLRILVKQVIANRILMRHVVSRGVLRLLSRGACDCRSAAEVKLALGEGLVLAVVGDGC